MNVALLEADSLTAALFRILGAVFPFLNLIVLIYLVRLFREVTRGMADIFLATRAAAEEVGKERLLDYLDGLAEDNSALQRAVKELEAKREATQRTYREFLEWRRSNGMSGNDRREAPHREPRFGPGA